MPPYWQRSIFFLPLRECSDLNLDTLKILTTDYTDGTDNKESYLFIRAIRVIFG